VADAGKLVVQGAAGVALQALQVRAGPAAARSRADCLPRLFTQGAFILHVAGPGGAVDGSALR